MNDGLGQAAEKKIKEWLDRPEEGYCFDRLPNQMNGFLGSANICDFTLFKSPKFYYLESKATWADRFDFSMVTDYQQKHMYEKSFIDNVECYVIVLFATYKRAFMINIQDFHNAKESGIKSLNIKKINDWKVNYTEIATVLSKKQFLDYRKDNNVL